MGKVYDFTLTVGADDSAANQVLALLEKNMAKATKKENVISITADATNVEKALKELVELNPTVGANIELKVDQSNINKEIDFLNSILNSKTNLDAEKITSKFKSAFTSGIKNAKLGDILSDEVGDSSRSIANVQKAVDSIVSRITNVDISESMDMSEMTTYVKDLETASILINEISKNKKLTKVDLSGLTSIVDNDKMKAAYSQIGQNIFMNSEQLLENLQQKSLSVISDFQKRLGDILRYGAGYEIVSSDELEKEKAKLAEMEQALAQTSQTAYELEDRMIDVANSIEKYEDAGNDSKVKALQQELLQLAEIYKRNVGIDLSDDEALDNGTLDYLKTAIYAVLDAKDELKDFHFQLVSEEEVEKQRSLVAELQNGVASAKKETSETPLVDEESTTRVKELEAEVESLREDLASAQLEARQLGEDLSTAQDELYEAQRAGVDFDNAGKVKELENQVDYLNEELRKAQETINTFANELTSAERRLESALEQQKIEINIEPNVEPEEFASKLSQQLKVPAKIEVEGQVSNPQAFADDVSKQIQSLSIENTNTASASEKTAEQTQLAADAIESEGEAAKEATKWKKDFAEANHLIAQASAETSKETKAAADAIESEGEAAKEAADGNRILKENADLLRYLTEIQQGTNTIQFGISIDKEMAEAELRKIAPEIAKSFNEKYGTNLTGAQVVKAYKASLKEQQAADEAALQSHLEIMEKRSNADDEAFQKQVQNWKNYIQQTAEKRNENENLRQLNVYDDAMAYSRQQAADELEYQQKLSMYKAQGIAQTQEIIAEEKEHAAWVEEVCKKQDEANALKQKQIDEAEQLAAYDTAMEYSIQQANEEAEYLKKRNEYLEYGRQQQEEYLRQAQDIAETFAAADKMQEASSTQHNNDAAKAYDKLFSSAKEYYSLLMKQENGSLSANEAARLSQLQSEWKDATSAVGMYSIETDGTTDSINRATAAQARFNSEAQNTSIAGVMKNLQSSYDKIQKMIDSGKYTSAFVFELSDVQSQIRDIMNTPLDLDDEKLRNKLSKLQSRVDESIGKKAFSDVRKAASSSLSKLELQINEFANRNSGMGKEFRQQFENIKIRLADAKSIADVENLESSIVKLRSEVEAAGRATRSFFDILRERIVGVNAQAIAQYFSWQDWIRYIRQMATTVTELDTALTEMRKVSDDSLSSLKAYQKTTFDTANAVGTTALALQKSTADWMRLGEAQKEAAESAKAATVLLNVSEFESIDEATEALVSVSQAYKDIDKMDIIDVINNIGNNYSIATNNLAEGLKNSAAVLKTQGNDLNEAVALLTAGNAITQDISKTSTGIRTIALRIAGTQEAKEQLAELGEDVDDFVVQTESKTQKLIKDYTAVRSNAYEGVDVLDANGNLRNTYDILLDIAKVYKEIQEEDLAAGTNRAQALVEYIAGKNRSNIAASILLNPDMLESVYNSAIDSTGSAERELAKYLESIEGHIARFQTQLQELEFDFLDSDTIKGFIDLGTSTLSVIDAIVDRLGMLGTIGTAAAIAAATRNFGGAKSCSHIIRRKSGFPYGYISFLMTKCEIHMGKTKRQYAGNCLHCYYSPTLMWTT